MFLKYLSSNNSKERIYGLDLVRAYAILFVVFAHSVHLLPRRYKFITAYFTLDGVSIFFVLSGFLIGRILIKTIQKNGATTQSLFNFWKRRWYRTLPNYFLILTLLILLSLGVSPTFELSLSIPYFYFGQNLLDSHPWFFPEAWSLSVEEWFYLLSPLVIWLSIRCFKVSVDQVIITLSLLTICIVTYYRYSIHLSEVINSWEIWDHTLRKRVFTRLDSIMYGVVAAYLSIFHPRNWSKYKNPLLIMGIIILIGQHIAHQQYPSGLNLYTNVFSFSFFSIGTLFLLPFLSEYQPPDNKFRKAVTSISLISYSLYLIHLTLVQGALIFISDLMNWSKEGSTLLVAFVYFAYWTLSIIGSILLYKYWEVPMMNLRDK